MHSAVTTARARTSLTQSPSPLIGLGAFGLGACLSLPTWAFAEEPASESASEPADAAAIDVHVFEPLLPRAGVDRSIPTFVVSRASLRAPGASLADALSEVPSLDVARAGGGADLATASLRGGTSAQTPVYFGPILLNDELTGTADLSQLSPSMLRAVEVFRGHSPIHLDRAGLSGAIVLLPELPGESGASVGGLLGSFGTRAVSGRMSVGGARGGSTLHVRFDETEGDFTYADDRGTTWTPSDDRDVLRENGDARSATVFSNTSLRIGERAEVSAFVYGLAREQGVTGLGVLPAEAARARTLRAQGAVTSTIYCASPDDPIGCKVDLSTSARLARYAITDPFRELPFASTYQEASAEGVTTRAALDLGSAVASASAGASMSFDSVRVTSRAAPTFFGERDRVRAFVGARVKPIAELEIHAEGAVETNLVLAGETRSSDPSPTLRLGLSTEPFEALTIFGSIGAYARIPTLGERFGVSASVLGNPTLVEERGVSGDLGARLSVEDGPSRFAVEGVFYGRKAEDLIGYVRSSFGALRPINVGEVRVLGAEVVPAFAFRDWLLLRGTFTWSDPRDLTRTERNLIPYESIWVISPSATITLRDLAPSIRWERLALSTSLTHRGPRTADPAGLIRLPAQNFLSAELDAGFSDGALHVRGRLANLLGDVTTDLVGYPLPGRSVFFEFEATWQGR